MVVKLNSVGVYVGYPGTSAFITNLSQYVAIAGAVPDDVEVFTDINQPMSQWVIGSQGAAAALHTSLYGSAAIPVVSVPMISDVSDGLTEAQNFAAITSGADDSVWLGIVQAYEAQGYTTIDIRLGEEQNGNWYPWSVSTPALAQAYISAFDHISALVHNVAGITVNVIWNPCAVTTSKVPTIYSYPGNAYVDIIGLDSYDNVYPFSLYDWSTHKVDATLAQWEANPVNLQHYWTYPDANVYHQTGTGQGFGLADAIAFAEANGKPLALPEIGTGGGATSPSKDDGMFLQYLQNILVTSGVPIAFADIYDSSSYTFTDGSKPNEAAAWAAFVKAIDDAGPSASPGSTSVGHGQTVNLGSQVAALVIPGKTGDTETITAVSATLGTATLGSGGAITYTAPASGTDTLTYTVTDQLGDTGTFTDTIAIDPGPTGGGGTVTAAHGQTVNLTSQILALVKPGLTGDTETITAITSTLGIVSLGAGGVVTYTAPASGTGTLTYTVTDQLGDKASFTSAIVVDPGPTLAVGSTSVVQGTTAALGTAIAALIKPGLTGDTETITAVSAAKGTATLGANGAISYTAPSTTGSDTLTYTVTDQYGDTATGSYAVSVIPTPATVSGDTFLLGPAYPSWGTPQAGVTVSLINAAGAVVATTVSSGGTYAFRSVSPGTYQLQFTPATGEVVSPSGIANVTTGRTAAFTLTPGQTYAAPNANFVQAAVVTGTVLLAGAGLSGVTVSLINSAGSVAATTTTNSTGAFTFNSLQAGSYQVQYTPPIHDGLATGGPASIVTNLTAPVTLTAGRTVTLAAETMIPVTATLSGSVVYAGAGQAEVAVALLNASGTVVATTTTSNTGAFTLTFVTPGTYQVQYTAPPAEVLQTGGPASTTTGLTSAITLTAGQVLTLDTETLVPAPATLSGSVVYAGAGQGGIAVALLTTYGVTVATTATASDGSFSFTGVPAGSYQVQYTAPPAEVLQAGGPASTATGLTSAITLAAGQTLILAAETLAPAIGSITGSVLYGAAGQAGMAIALLNTTGTVVATTTTSSTGTFSFTNVPVGSYQVQYTPPTNDGLISGGPANTTTFLTSVITLTAGQTVMLAAESVTPVIISGDTFLLGPAYPSWGIAQSGVTVSLINATGAVVATTVSTNGYYVFRSVSPSTYQLQFTPVSGEVISPNGIANVTTGLTAAFTLNPNQLYALPNVNFVQAATVTGTVLLAGAGLPGVTVSLLNTAGSVVATTATSSTGTFTFGALEAGSYQVQYTPPAHYTLVTGGPANITTDLTSAITLTAGQTVTLAAETVTPVAATLSGSVVYAGAGQAGVAVALLNASGTVVATATTNSTGSFTFTGVPAGTYQVKYTAPPAEVLLAGGPASTSTGLTAAITVTADTVLNLGVETLIPATGTVMGKVYHLGSADPSWGSPQSGVSVALVNAAGTIVATTATTGAGYFQFANVADGTYSYIYTLPAGEAFQAGGPVNAATGASTPFVITAGSSQFTPTVDVVSSSNSFALNGAGAVALRGPGNYTVTGNASGGTLTLGNGNDSINLTGGGDTITVGAGTSTITALGANNLITAGPGMSFITVDTSAGNKFVTNAAGQGLETISGFTSGDVLDLAHTLAGVSIASNLSNLGSYITAATNGGNTTLLVNPSGSGTASAFVQLNGVNTSVSALINGHNFSLT